MTETDGVRLIKESFENGVPSDPKAFIQEYFDCPSSGNLRQMADAVEEDPAHLGLI